MAVCSGDLSFCILALLAGAFPAFSTRSTTINGHEVNSADDVAFLQAGLHVQSEHFHGTSAQNLNSSHTLISRAQNVDHQPSRFYQKGPSKVTADEKALTVFLVVMLATLAVVICVAFLTYLDTSSTILGTTSDFEQRSYSWYRKLFWIHFNREFGFRAEHAFRAAMLFALYALPFFWPRPLPAFDYMISSGVYSSYIGQQILFNFKPTVGKTIAASAQLLTGTGMAFIAIFIMFGFFPAGVTVENSEMIYMFGILSGGAFTLAMLWLKFPVRVTIFALARFAEYWMAFLNPTVDPALSYSVGFVFKPSGNALKAFIGAIAGSTLALLGNLVPYPDTSIGVAENECCLSIGLLKENLLVYYDFMMQPAKRSELMSQMHRDLLKIRSHIDSCNDHLHESWWECLGLGSRQRKRARLTALNQAVHEMKDGLLGVLESLTARADTYNFGAHHVEIMDSLQAIRSLIESCGETLYFCSKAVHYQGPLCLADLHRCRDSVRSGILSITEAFLKVKSALALHPIDVEYLDEHVFCRSMCVFARHCCDIAVKLMAECQGETQLTTKYNGPSVSSVFDFETISSRVHLEAATRHTLAFFTLFALGNIGCYGVLRRHTSSLASTMALLISPGLNVGLQLAKNLSRLQGVVLGSILGQLLHRFAGSCNFLSCTTSTLILCTYVWVNLLLHLSGHEYSYLCFLLALFGQDELVQPCIYGDHAILNEKLQSVYGVVVTISIMAVIDLMVPSDVASIQATEAIEHLWLKMTEAVAEVFNPNIPLQRRDRKGAMIQAISMAQLMGVEAGQEFRYWKTPWRKESFAKCVDALLLIRGAILCIEDCIPDEPVTSSSIGSDHDTKSQPSRTELKISSRQDFESIIRRPSMQEVLKVLTQDMNHQRDLLQIFRHESTTPLQQFHKPTMLQYRWAFHDGLVAYAKDASRQLIASDCANSLEYDVAARVSHMLACLYTIREQMILFEITALRNG